MLFWVKSTQGQWLSLEKVNLAGVTTQGVYIIWHGGNPARTVYVGQGDIAARLAAHRQRPEIQRYAQHGLFVTWAAVSADRRDGVERHFADTLRPLVGDAHPDVPAIQENGPW